MGKELCNVCYANGKEVEATWLPPEAGGEAYCDKCYKGMVKWINAYKRIKE